MNLRQKRIVFISPPYHKTFYSHIDPNRYEKTVFIVGQLCAKYNAIYLNYTKDERFSEQDFRDSLHLYVDGAAKLGRIVKSDLSKNNEVLSLE